MIDLAVPQRQSKLAVVFLAIRLLRRLGLAQLVVIAVFIFNGPFDLSIAALASLAIVALGALSLLAWWRFTFRFASGELVVERGILSTSRLSIPVERIQSMSLEQELLHRIVGLVKVTVETAGSEDAEFTIDAVDRPVAEQLQEAVRAERSALPEQVTDAAGLAVVDPDPEEVVFQHDTDRLVRMALTMWPLTGLAVLGSIFAASSVVGSQLEDRVFDIDPDRFRWWWIPIGAIALLALSVILNVVRVLTQDWKLTLRRGRRSLRRTAGLLSLTNRSSSIDRVQVVSTSQNPLQRAAGLREVHLSTVGSGDLTFAGCDDEQSLTVRTIAEIDTSAAAPTRRVHPIEILLNVRNTTIIAGLGAVLGWFQAGWWVLFAVLAPIVVGLTTWRHVRTHRWELDDRLSTFTHVVDRSTEEALLRKTNAVTVSQSFFERRRDLATVELATAAGAIEIGMIPLDEANAVRDVILHAAETDPRPWM